MLFVGDDWAEDHHDVELQDDQGRVLVRARLAEGIVGIARLHELIGQHVGEADEADRVVIGIETDRGPWVAALVAAGYGVFAVNPLQAARFRETESVSGAKSDRADAHTLAELVRVKRHLLRPVAADSERAEAVKVVTRAHKTLIWERSRHLLRLRAALREYFPAALDAFDDLAGADTLDLLGRAADPVRAARLSRAQITAALKRARRHHAAAKAEKIQTVLRSQQLAQPAVLTAAYAATVRAEVAILAALNEQISAIEAEVETHFSAHPDVEIYRSQPGLGTILGARVLAEFGDDPHRYADARARKNYAGTSPITRQSGRTRIVHARYIHNDRLIDALNRQAFAALKASPGARAFYDAQRARGLGHYAALRRLANRLVGILHGCLKTGTPYNEDTAWAHRAVSTAA